MLRKLFAAVVVSGALQAADASAEPFYDAALCRPPYTMTSATALYEAAEKLGQPDKSLLTAYVYKLPEDVGQDGFKTSELVFAGTSVGVLVQGQQAEALAQRYQLQRERSSLLGASSKGYARELPAAEQPQPEAGTVSVIARESPALPGKTLLACEFVSKEDRASLEDYEKYRSDRIREDREPVEKAANRLAASPGNAASIAAYREALTKFLIQHPNADTALIEDYRAKLDALPGSR
ncbi:MAG TPA: hypothetical protein VN157_00160 [Caulobacter sp.]|nr:hypothetical protein [Caulobacter sp.]